MTILALAAEYETMWLVALGAGAVVLTVVVGLLTLLYRIVVDIDEGVEKVWETATRLASNTATTWQLRDTAAILSDVKAETMRHSELLKDRSPGSQRH